MKTLTLIALLFLGAQFVIAQESTEVRNVAAFAKIDVSEGIKVELTMGEKQYVEVITEKDIMASVVTEVIDHELRIYIKGDNWNNNRKKITVKVTATKMEAIDAGSGASIITQNLIESESLEMDVSSGATIRVALKAPNASCDASSGASAYLKGVTKFLDVEASSGSSIHAEELKAVNVEAEASSGASITIDIEGEFKGNASSGGSISYSGTPTKVDIEKSSGGSIKKN